METGITTAQIVNEMARVAHGKLETYIPVIKQACIERPELIAHAIGWNVLKGQSRDSRIALPVITLSSGAFPEELLENSLAHLASFDPKLLWRACQFAKSMRPSVTWVFRKNVYHSIDHVSRAGDPWVETVKEAKKTWGKEWQTIIQDVPLPKGNTNLLEGLIHRYLKTLESNWKKWERTCVQHRVSLKNLYSAYRVKPSEMARKILFEGVAPRGTVFEKIRNLSTMSPDEAAGVIKRYKLPAVVIAGAAGKRMEDQAVAMAMLNRATATEVVTNTKLFKRLGAKNDPVVRAAYEEALKRVAESKTNTYKTTRAAEVLEEEGEDVLAAKLRAVQEKQIDRMATLDGNWLVLGDKSPSMTNALEGAKHLAGAIARSVRGQVMLVFFDSGPTAFDVTRKTYEEIKQMTRFIVPGGGTSIGCGLKYAMDRNFEIDGIAIASDARENTPPWFATTLKDYKAKTSRDPSVYLYRFRPSMAGPQDIDLAASMKQHGLDLNEKDLTASDEVDYYSLPGYVSTMRVGRYSLEDEIMAVPLVTLDEVLQPLAVTV